MTFAGPKAGCFPNFYVCCREATWPFWYASSDQAIEGFNAKQTSRRLPPRARSINLHVRFGPIADIVTRSIKIRPPGDRHRRSMQLRDVFGPALYAHRFKR